MHTLVMLKKKCDLLQWINDFAGTVITVPSFFCG